MPCAGNVHARILPHQTYVESAGVACTAFWLLLNTPCSHSMRLTHHWNNGEWEIYSKPNAAASLSAKLQEHWKNTIDILPRYIKKPAQCLVLAS